MSLLGMTLGEAGVPLHEVDEEVLDFLLAHGLGEPESDVAVHGVAVRVLQRVVQAAPGAAAQALAEEPQVSLGLGVGAVDELVAVEGVEDVGVLLGRVPLAVDWSAAATEVVDLGRSLPADGFGVHRGELAQQRKPPRQVLPEHAIRLCRPADQSSPRPAIILFNSPAAPADRAAAALRGGPRCRVRSEPGPALFAPDRAVARPSQSGRPRSDTLNLIAFIRIFEPKLQSLRT